MTRGSVAVSGGSLEVGPGCRREDRRAHLRRRLGPFCAGLRATEEEPVARQIGGRRDTWRIRSGGHCCLLRAVSRVGLLLLLARSARLRDRIGSELRTLRTLNF